MLLNGKLTLNQYAIGHLRIGGKEQVKNANRPSKKSPMK